jgi:hypothetical protein
MKDLGFILASWIITLRRARELSSRIPDEHKPWV